MTDETKYDGPGYGIEVRDDLIHITVGTETVAADAATWIQLSKDGFEMQCWLNPGILSVTPSGEGFRAREKLITVLREEVAELRYSLTRIEGIAEDVLSDRGPIE